MTYLRDAINAQQAALLTSGKSNRLFSAQNTSNGPYTYDVDSWAYPIRNLLTCRAAYNTWGGYYGGPTLIHPRFAISAWHFWLNSPGVVGRKAYFKAVDGTLYERTVTAQHQIGSGLDIGLIQFVSDLPSDIVPAKLFPNNYRCYLRPRTDSRVSAFTYMATLSSSLLRCTVRDCIDLRDSAIFTEPLTNDPRLAWSEAASMYGSGSPAFILLDGQLVLLGTWFSGTACAHLAPVASLIESAMSEMAESAQTISRVSLADYDVWPLTASISASPQIGPTGTQVTLTWATDDGATTTLNGTSVGTSGSRIVTIGDTTYTVTATIGANSASASVTLDERIAPTVSFTASDYSIILGESTTISWVVSGATSISINNGVGAVTATDSLVVSPEQTTTYTLTAVNDETVTASLTIRVTVPAESEDNLATIKWVGNASTTTNLDEDNFSPAVIPAAGDTLVIDPTTPGFYSLPAWSDTISPDGVNVIIQGTLTEAQSLIKPGINGIFGETAGNTATITLKTDANYAFDLGSACNLYGRLVIEPMPNLTYGELGLGSLVGSFDVTLVNSTPAFTVSQETVLAATQSKVRSQADNLPSVYLTGVSGASVGGVFPSLVIDGGENGTYFEATPEGATPDISFNGQSIDVFLRGNTTLSGNPINKYYFCILDIDSKARLGPLGEESSFDAYCVIDAHNVELGNTLFNVTAATGTRYLRFFDTDDEPYLFRVQDTKQTLAPKSKVLDDGVTTNLGVAGTLSLTSAPVSTGALARGVLP